jgi:predicted nucleic acid-binding protein
VAKRSARSPSSRVEPAAVRYIESSALAAALLERDAAALKSLRSRGRRITSALTIAETARAILRARTTGRVSDDQERSATRALRRFERRCFLVAITHEILDRVRRRFPIEPVRTLDAVHLATVEWLGEPAALTVIVTRDDRVRENARALGYAVE